MRLWMTNDDEINGILQKFISVLHRQKRILLVVFGGVLFTVATGTFFMSPVYKSAAKVLLERQFDSEKALLLRLHIPQNYEKYDWLKSEIEILGSYPVAARVIQGIGLEKFVKVDGNLTTEERDRLLQKTVEEFQDRLEVRHVRNSNVVDVAYECEDAELSAGVVNRVIGSYMEYRSQVYDQSEAYEFYEQQLHQSEEELRTLEQRQAVFKHEEAFLAPDVQVQILLRKLADYEMSLTAVRTKRIGRESKLTVVEEQIEQGSATNIPAMEVSDSPSREKYIAKLKGELLDMQMKRDRLLQRFKPDYIEILEIEEQIALTKERMSDETVQIVDQEKTAIKALRAEERALQNSVDEINREVKGFADKEFENTQLSRGIADTREIYSTLLKQREEVKLSLARLDKDIQVRIISPAVAPLKPAKPHRLLNLGLGGFIGLISAFSLAFFAEYHGFSLHAIEQFEKNGEIHSPESM